MLMNRIVPNDDASDRNDSNVVDIDDADAVMRATRDRGRTTYVSLRGHDCNTWIRGAHIGALAANAISILYDWVLFVLSSMM